MFCGGSGLDLVLRVLFADVSGRAIVEVLGRAVARLLGDVAGPGRGGEDGGDEGGEQGEAERHGGSPVFGLRRIPVARRLEYSIHPTYILSST